MPSLIGYIFGDNPRNFLYLYLKKNEFYCKRLNKEILFKPQTIN